MDEAFLPSAICVSRWFVGHGTTENGPFANVGVVTNIITSVR